MSKVFLVKLCHFAIVVTFIVKTAAAKLAASASRICCAHSGAMETARGSVALKPCSRCKAAVYCGRECQAAHWKAGGHREVCKEGKKSTGI